MSRAQGQFTIIDYNDALTLTGYIGCNHPKTQMFNPDNNSYTPNWASTNLVLTPSLYIIGTTTDQITSENVTMVKWYQGTSTTAIASGGNYTLIDWLQTGQRVGTRTAHLLYGHLLQAS